MITHGGRLPAESTRFFGRSREVAVIKDAVGRGRLVTLTGPGGVGKTRLAVRVARDMRAAFPDGVAMVQLSALRGPGLLVATVSDALGLAERTALPQVEELVEHLRGKRVLLILDTCEHLVDECAMLVDTLLGGADGLRLLVTSRQALDLPGEVVHRIMPLPVPDDGGDAAALFADRVAAALPGFTVTGKNLPQIVRLCRRLDGIPLAIELAAVRLRAIGLDELLARLGGRLRLLGGGGSGRTGEERTAEDGAAHEDAAQVATAHEGTVKGRAFERHQTLRAAIGWSYDLCSPAERLLWARLSVFAGDFGLEAVERVCGGDDLACSALVDALIGLVDKSIVLRADSPGADSCPAGPGGAPGGASGGASGGAVHADVARYRMLDTIRQYGAELLAEAGHYRRRHRDYYLTVARRFGQAFLGPDQLGWIARMRADEANLRLALEYCLCDKGEDEGEEAAGLELATALWGFWGASNHPGEGRYWLERMLDGAPELSAHRVKALCITGWFMYGHGDAGAAAPLLAQARSAAARIGDETVSAWVEGFAAQARVYRGDPRGVASAYADVLSRMSRAGHLAGLCMTLVGKAHAQLAAGNTAECLADCEELLRLLPEGECWLSAWILWLKSLACWRAGKHAAFAESLRAGTRLGFLVCDQKILGCCLEGLAWLAAEEGDARRAARLLGAAGQMRQAVGSVLKLATRALQAQHDAAERRAREILGATRYPAERSAGAALAPDEAVRYALGPEGCAEAETTDAAGESLWEALTAREREVAALVADGLTNRDIAARLVVSKRTVDAHVEHILDKLGCSSRVQVAALVPVPQSEPPGRPGLARPGPAGPGLAAVGRAAPGRANRWRQPPARGGFSGARAG